MGRARIDRCVRCTQTRHMATAALCKTCHTFIWRKKNPDKYRAQSKRNNDKVKSTIRFTRHGITEAIYQEMLDRQGNACAVCRNSFENYHIDHDHACCPGDYSCGKCVRGLLCQLCNQMLGQARDSIETLQAGIDYLKGVRT